MKVAISGTDRMIQVDRRFVKMLPRSLWMVTTAQGKCQPTGRYLGRTMTVVRMIGLMAGMPNCQYILPRNGDWFDCRIRNVGGWDAVPGNGRACYKNSVSGHKGIRKQGNRFSVVLCINGKQQYFGSAKTVEEAVKIRAQI